MGLSMCARCTLATSYYAPNYTLSMLDDLIIPKHLQLSVKIHNQYLSIILRSGE